MWTRIWFILKYLLLVLFFAAFIKYFYVPMVKAGIGGM